MAEQVVYNASSIETLDFRTAIRSRIAMYMGSADNQGVLQCIREIITNSIDEATMGFGKKIVVKIFKNNRVYIEDFGRGCPFGIRADGTEALEAIYTTPHSGAKFNDKVFQNVAGMNGIGAKGVALSAETFKVWSHRDGETAFLQLRDGIKTSFTVAPTPKVPNGTAVEFVPSQEVYNLEPIHIDFAEVKKMCRDWSYLSKGIEFDLYDEASGEHVTYLSKEGLVDLIRQRGKSLIHRTPLHTTIAENGIEAEIVMGWTSDRSETWHVFTNGLENSEGGTSLTGIKTALTNFFKKKIKGDAQPDILRKGLFYAVSCKVPNPSFANQTKTKVNNPELRGLCQRATTLMLEAFERNNSEEFNRIVEMLTKEVRAEAAAETARKKVLETSAEIERNQKAKVFESRKLKDAEFLGQDSTLLIVEGDSALGGMSQARDYKRFGLLAIRGKIINCLSNDEEDIFDNEEIKLLLSAMNIVPGKYNGSKLRYGRLGIAVDGDGDGRHIALLITAAIYYLAPQFIKEGRLFWLRAPLYIVNNKGVETYYYTEEEFNAARHKVRGEVTRAKGLGELDADTARRSMFSPQFQRLEPMEWDDAAIELLCDLMGKPTEPRTEYVFSKIDFSTIRE